MKNILIRSWKICVDIILQCNKSSGAFIYWCLLRSSRKTILNFQSVKCFYLFSVYITSLRTSRISRFYKYYLKNCMGAQILHFFFFCFKDQCILYTIFNTYDPSHWLSVFFIVHNVVDRGSRVDGKRVHFVVESPGDTIANSKFILWRQINWILTIKSTVS